MVTRRKNVPPIVERCIEQWRQKNPTWQVIVLDRQNLHEFLDLKLPNHLFSKLTPQQQSDLIRLTLLMQQGGVWADATTFCITPLNEWLSSLINSGCFLFSRPGKDRLIASWFIAAYPNHYLIHSWHDFLAHYWLDNTFEPLNFWQQQLVNILYIFLTFNCYVTQYWFSDVITKFLKVYPYYSLHYAFFSLIHRDSRAKELWQSIPYLSANVPLKLVRRG
ncbi:MAG TPA: hypothetical protein IGP91_03430 [Thermosynechococcus sp. M46_R2017_013]|nr:hypothetical protein [Thermosynechococcus sp. M46_R2017_013]